MHPKQAGQYNDFYHNCLGELLKGPRVSAFGEMGLDFEQASCRERALQESTLRWVLRNAMEDVPLVLHLRGARGDPASQKVGGKYREIFRQVGISHLQKTQLHCFSGGGGGFRKIQSLEEPVQGQ